MKLSSRPEAKVRPVLPSNDTALLQTLINHSVPIPPGSYHLTKTLTLIAGTLIENCHFYVEPDVGFPFYATSGLTPIPTITNCFFNFLTES